MKMEVLSVQNHIQGQFGVIGTTKVKDWTSPLTAPGTGGGVGSGAVATAAENPTETRQRRQVEQVLDVDEVDVVDGHPSSVLHMRQHQALNTRPRTATAAAVAAGAAVNRSAYFYEKEEHHLAAAAADDIDAAARNELSLRLQAKLREAKSRHLTCTEVTLPFDLTQRIAAEVIRMSEREPCGERACTIYIEFESEPSNVRRIASLKVDPDTVSVFELYLTLKQDKSGWTSRLPQFLKNLTRSNTIMISPDFTLTKNKLYSSE